MRTVAGIAASPGIAIAKAYLLEMPELQVERQTVADTKAELQRLERALAAAKAELEEIRLQTEARLGADKAAIFEAHVLVLSDPELIGAVQAKVESEGVNAEYALAETADFYISLFAQMDNDYMKERAADIEDVTQRVLAQLLQVKLPDLSLLQEEVVIVAEDLTPSETAQMDRRYVKGFTTNIGGRTSHSAIMARSLGIPAIVGTKDITRQVQDGEMIILDGNDGMVLVQPDEEQLVAYNDKQLMQQQQQEQWRKLVQEPSVTADGHTVELAANIGTPDDVAGALVNGAEGVGLFRTEFLYMGRNALPTEEEQLQAYRAVLEGMGGKPVVVRTLDIGGDKELPYLQLPKELNPFLGFRAIRLCLAETDIFRTQIRALLRASVSGNLKIMFPMIATLQEFRAAKEIVAEEKAKLQASGHAVSEAIELGIMIEIPAAALLADQFAKEVDFFSIGTNDLIQYTMAADRMNEQVAHLYQPFNPALLRLIDGVIQAAHAQGKWVGMCGEMAGDLQALPILLALGLDEFSMSAASILPTRSALRGLSQLQLQQLREEILAKATPEEVLALLDEQLEEVYA